MKTKENNMDYKAIDIMKLICAILIVLIHTNPFYGTELSFIINNNIARIAVPLFFITSGYLVWGKYKGDKAYIFKYIKSLLKIIITWTIVYLPFNIYYYKNLDISLIKKIIFYIRDFLFQGTYIQLWYLNALVISIIFIIFLYKYLSLKKIGIIALGFYIIGLLGDSYFGLFNNRLENLIINIYSLVFGSTRNGFLFGTIFIVIGILIKEYGWNFKINKKSNLILIIITFIVLLIETYFLRNFEIAKDYNMMISLLFLAPLIFISILNTTKFKNVENTKIFRSLSLWVYCIHGIFLIIGKGIESVSRIDYFIFVLTFSIISYFLVKIIFENLVIKE